jgi:glucokinase
MKYYVGIDLGGTNIVAGVVDEEYNIIAKASTKTNCPRPEKEIADDMARWLLRL